jgi:23S rRNA pseudouridine2457 synthase
MLPQFSDDQGRPTLGQLYDFPKDVYPVGRLDMDSEGLLVLTNDKKMNSRLLHPKNEHTRTYWAQVEGEINEEATSNLEKGVTIRINKKDYKTLPAKAKILDTPNLPERNPPIRYRKSVPDSWLELTLTEGKNRQVRKMTAAVGFPTLRLVRASISDLKLGNMQAGDVKELDKGEIYPKLFGKLKF